MRKLKADYSGLPKELEARLSEFCTSVGEVISCMHFSGLGELRKQLLEIKKGSQHLEVLYIEEVFGYFEKNNISLNRYSQFILNTEALYIKLYMINEIIKKYKKLPPLNIPDLEVFRLVFTHAVTPRIFHKSSPFVYFIRWFKPDLSEMSFRFFDFNGKNQRDIIMYQSKNIQSFQDWYNIVYETI